MLALVVVSSIFSSSSCRWDEQDEERFLDTRQQSNRAKRGTRSSLGEENTDVEGPVGEEGFARSARREEV